MRHDSEKGATVKRPRRYILKGVTLLSLLFCAGTMGLWVLSYNTPRNSGGGYHFELATASNATGWSYGIALGWYDGRITIHSQSVLEQTPKEVVLNLSADMSGRYEITGVFSGPAPLISFYSDFRIEKWPNRFTRYATIPIWWVVVLTLMPPTIAFDKRCRSRQKIRLGMCVVCGYDLRATPDRCPECGAIPKKI